jgi:hypothetical protein
LAIICGKGTLKIGIRKFNSYFWKEKGQTQNNKNVAKTRKRIPNSKAGMKMKNKICFLIELWLN